MIPPHWHIAESALPFQTEVEREFGLHPVTAQILWNRGVRELSKIETFLQPSLQHLPNPFELPDMEKACHEIVLAIREKRKIAVFGDYDVDGVSATAILARFFADIDYPLNTYLPHREKDGYGLSKHGIDQLLASGTQLLITVDNGSSAQAEITYAREQGLHIIVTDHHEANPHLSGVEAHINPKLLSSPHVFEGLSGSGVAFFLVMALRKTLREAGLLATEPSLKTSLSLATLGTVADVMPLTGVNRTIIWYGLKELRNTQILGLQALMAVSKTKPEQVSPTDISFRLAPRLNAAGRLAHPKTAFDLLSARDEKTAAELAQQLQQLNQERQALEERMLREAEQQIAALPQLPSGIVCYAPHWHIGVMGIAASRLVENYQRPTIVCAGNGPEIKGSARTPRGFHLLNLLKPCEQHLLRFGGHAEAAGLTMHIQHLEKFSTQFSQACAAEPVSGPPPFHLDAELSPELVTEKLMNELELLEPFGHRHPAPVFCARELVMKKVSIVGKHHLKFQIQSGSLHFDSIAFDQGRNPLPAANTWILAYRPEWNEWNGSKKLQLNVKALVGKN